MAASAVYSVLFLSDANCISMPAAGCSNVVQDVSPDAVAHASLQGIARHAGAAVHAMLHDGGVQDFIVVRSGTARQLEQQRAALGNFVGARLSPHSLLKEPFYKQQALEVRDAERSGTKITQPSVARSPCCICAWSGRPGEAHTTSPHA